MKLLICKKYAKNNVYKTKMQKLDIMKMLTLIKTTHA